ncbi:MAG: hypothetical protein M0Q01_03825 [Syntrophales bacterium]|jgi:hypothetical protein|nr:hypothetical protein [Syntrophales bacterium]
MDIYVLMVNDFIQSARMRSGYGIFQGIEMVSNMARILSKNAIRGFERYGIVPQLFFQCLRQIGLMDSTAEIPKKGVSLKCAVEILKAAGLRERLSRDDFFDLGLHIQSCSQQHLWEKLEIMKRQPKKINFFAGRGQHTKMKGGLPMIAY